MIDDSKRQFFLERRPPAHCAMVSCDENYFRKHFVPFFGSSEKHSTPVHAHIINPEPKTIEFMKALIHISEIDVGFSFEMIDLSSVNSRVYYTVSRFFALPALLEFAPIKIFVLDIDSLIQRPLPFPEADYGLFLREWAVEGECSDGGGAGVDRELLLSHELHDRMVMASAVYASSGGLSYFKRVVSALREEEDSWHADQRALWRAHDWVTENDPMRFVRLTNRFLDWEFRPETAIWTGKGERKATDQRYLAYQEACRGQFEQKYPDLAGMI